MNEIHFHSSAWTSLNQDSGPQRRAAGAPSARAPQMPRLAMVLAERRANTHRESVAQKHVRRRYTLRHIDPTP